MSNCLVLYYMRSGNFYINAIDIPSTLCILHREPRLGSTSRSTYSDRTGSGKRTPNADSRVRIQPCILSGAILIIRACYHVRHTPRFVLNRALFSCIFLHFLYSSLVPKHIKKIIIAS